MGWKGVAEVLNKGLSALPDGVWSTCCLFAVLAIFMSTMQQLGKGKNWGQYVPSPLACGLAFIVPPFNSITIVCGGLAAMLWERLSKGASEELRLYVASGLL